MLFRRSIVALALAGALSLALGVSSALAQASVQIVSACGGANIPLGPYPYIQELQDGQLCISASGGGGGAVTGPLGPTTLPAAAVATITPAITPAPLTASAIVTGGTALNLVTGPVNGCYITNPLTAADQNIASAEVAYFNPVTTATAVGRGTNSSLQPGQTWYCPGGLAAGVNVSGLAATTGHAFSGLVW